MKLIRYRSPELGVFNDIDNILERAALNFGRFPSVFENWSTHAAVRRPAMDYSEDDTSHYIRFELPGVKKSDVTVEYQNGTLTVSGERKEKTKEGERMHSFERSITLPEGIAEGEAKAHFKDGLLTVTLPKSAAPERKTIAIT